MFVVAKLESEISAGVLIPDLVTSVVESESSWWKVRDDIIVVGHTLVAI